MRVSVVTAVLNRASTLAECLASVRQQTHPSVEHVVVDGGSTDGSLELLRAHSAELGPWVSEPDRGLYDAVNKGIALASGDLVGVLGADDVYAHPRVLERVAAAVEATGADSCYGDLLYVRQDDPGRVVRTWVAGGYRRGAFRRGWMPPHPTFFLRRARYLEHGAYDTTFRIAADYELMLRLLEREGLTTTYVPEVLVRMRLGGASNRPADLARKSWEDWRAWRVNGLAGGVAAVALKNLTKLPQFLPGGGEAARPG